MARLVVDTNSLIQCISRRSRYHDLWLSFLDGRNVMCVSTEILSEYAEILERYTSPERVRGCPWRYIVDLCKQLILHLYLVHQHLLLSVADFLPSH